MTQWARTLGHGYTFLEWMGIPIQFVKQIVHVAPTPVGTAVDIQPINHLRPMEIASPRAIAHGMLTVQFIEGWQHLIWKQLATFAQSTDLADVFDHQNRLGTPIHVQKIILNPGGTPLGQFNGGNNTNAGVPGVNHRVETYHGCKVTDIRNGETVTLDAIESVKDVDIWYTHCTHNPSPAPGAAHQTRSAQNTTEGAQRD